MLWTFQLSAGDILVTVMAPVCWEFRVGARLLVLGALGAHAHAGLSVFRKNAVELELTKCRMDMMSLNSQLLDAIQQKLNLSQQLEAWQVKRLETRVREDGAGRGEVFKPRQRLRRVHYSRVPCMWVSPQGALPKDASGAIGQGLPSAGRPNFV